MLFDILSVKVWAMESGYFNRISPIAYRLISSGQSLSKLIDQEKRAEIIPNVQYDRDSGLVFHTSSTNRRIARIGIVGGLTKNGDLCAYGMKDYVKMIENANKSVNIDGIMLEMDTPGGSVDGTEELGAAVKQSKKPTLVFGDQMVASAGYWIASQANHIMANKLNDTEFGSIGVLYVHENWSKFIEKEIGAVTIFRAPQSKDKALINPIEELPADQEKEILNDLQSVATRFISTVKKGRSGKLNTGDENIFTGKMYDRKNALELGMIDSIGTREDAIELAGELAQQHISSNKSNKNQSSMKWSKISSLFGGKASEESEELSAEEKAQLDAAELKLTDQEKQISDLQKQVNDKDAKIATLESEKKTLSDEKGELEKTVTEQKAQLDKDPAGQTTTVVKTDEEFADEKGKGKKTFETSVDKEVREYREQLGIKVEEK